MKRIAIIGGGAAGLAAAVRAAQEARSLSTQVEITVYEAADRVGKSILASGNGRCNFSNYAVVSEEYHNNTFVDQGFKTLPPTQVLEFFQQIGLLWQEESEGRLYPRTNKASTVLDVLRFAAQGLGVEFNCNKKIYALTPCGEEHTQGRILVSGEDDQAVFCDAAILACGGKVSRSILPPSYTYINTQPLLVPLKTNTDAIKGLNNIRVRCEVSAGGVSEYGEVLFREYGVSGIVVFNLSRFVVSGDTLRIDFLPEMELAQVEALLRERYEHLENRNSVDFLAGLLLPAVARAVLKVAGISPDNPLDKNNIPALAGALKLFPLEVEGVEDYRQAQVQRGGFSVDSFNPKTMQSIADPGLFVAGEACDVDGPCGGYNLHWAWTSGIIAGQSAIRLLAQ